VSVFGVMGAVVVLGHAKKQGPKAGRQMRLGLHAG